MSLLNNKQSSTAKQYQAGSDDLSYGQLRAARWYVRNKARLANLGTVFLAIVALGFFGFAFVMWVGYLAIGMQADADRASQSVRQFQNYTLLHEQFAPDNIEVGGVRVVQTEAERPTVLTEVRNPNPEWIATVTFRYSVDAQETVRKQAILPTQRTALIAFGLAVPTPSVSLEILGVDWQRVSPHSVPDPAEYMAARLAMPVDGVEIEVPDGVQNIPGRVSFRIQNESAYGYWVGSFYVLFYSGDQIVDARLLEIESFFPGYEDRVQYNLGFDQFGVSDIEVIPNINVFDNSVYLPIES